MHQAALGINMVKMKITINKLQNIYRARMASSIPARLPATAGIFATAAPREDDGAGLAEAELLVVWAVVLVAKPVEAAVPSTAPEPEGLKRGFVELTSLNAPAVIVASTLGHTCVPVKVYVLVDAGFCAMQVMSFLTSQLTVKAALCPEATLVN